jgi:hypothetical protein
MAPADAIEVLLGLSPLHLQVEADVRAGTIDSTAVNSDNQSLRDVDLLIITGNETKMLAEELALAPVPAQKLMCR